MSNLKAKLTLCWISILRYSLLTYRSLAIIIEEFEGYPVIDPVSNTTAGNLKGQWHRKFLLAISILLDDLTMKILSFRSQTF